LLDSFDPARAVDLAEWSINNLLTRAATTVSAAEYLLLKCYDQVNMAPAAVLPGALPNDSLCKGVAVNTACICDNDVTLNELWRQQVFHADGPAVKPLEVGEAGPELLQTPTNRERERQRERERERERDG